MNKATIFVKKLSVREMFGSATEIKKAAINLPNDGDKLPLFRIVGLVSLVRRVETQYGESYGLRGEFIATLVRDGSKFASMEAFLPDFATQLVMGALNSAKHASENKADVTVEIALDIGLQRVDKLAIGYEYTVTPVTPLQTSSPLERLMKQAEENKPLALAAPAVHTETEADAPKSATVQAETAIPAKPTPAAEKKPETGKKK